MSNSATNLNSQSYDAQQHGAEDLLAGNPEQPETQTELVEKVLAPFAEILSALAQVWTENRRLLSTLVLVLVLLPLIAGVVSLLAVIHSIPLLAAFLKLIGMGYSIWFVSGYLFLATKRQRLLGLWQKLLEATKTQ